MTKRSNLTIIIIILLAGFVGYEILTAINNPDDNKSYNKTTSIKKVNDQKINKYPKAPDFSLYDLNGNLVNLSDHEGKVVIIDFWATWCGPCRMGIPDFVELQSKYKEQGFIILGISVDQGNRQIVDEFARVFKINYPVLFFTPEVITAYGGIQGIPTTFIVDRDGRIRDKIVGYHHKNYFINTIESLL